MIVTSKGILGPFTIKGITMRDLMSPILVKFSDFFEPFFEHFFLVYHLKLEHLALPNIMPFVLCR